MTVLKSTSISSDIGSDIKEVSVATIDRVDVLLLDIPTVRQHVLSMATINKQSVVLVRLYFSDGIVGLGEATTIGGLSYGDESPEGIKLAIDTYFAPLLVGKRFESIAQIMANLTDHIVGNRFAKCAIETALLDALGKRLNVPVSMLLGGHIREHLPVAWVLASGDIHTDIDEAAKMISDQRHKVFKIKIGKRSLHEDVAHVAAIKKAIGDKGSVRVDVNQAWSKNQAVLGCAMLTDAGIDLIEQPVAHDDIRCLTRVVGQNGAPILADESVRGPRSAFEICREEAADVFSIKIAQSGGLVAAQQVANIVSTAGFGLYGGTMLESSIGTVASAHTFATLPNLEWGTELFAPLLLTDGILTEPLVYSDFQLEVPTGPGLGIELDEDKVRFFSRG